MIPVNVKDLKGCIDSVFKFYGNWRFFLTLCGFLVYFSHFCNCFVSFPWKLNSRLGLNRMLFKFDKKLKILNIFWQSLLCNF